MIDKTSRAVVLKHDETSSLLVCGVQCFSRMLISNVHKSIIVMNSLDTRFSRNVFEAVQKPRSTYFIRSKTTRLRLAVLNPIKHCCSCFKHDINSLLNRSPDQSFSSLLVFTGCDLSTRRRLQTIMFSHVLFRQD